MRGVAGSRSGHHQLQFRQVLPMFPVYSVTYLSGCSFAYSTRSRLQLLLELVENRNARSSAGRPFSLDDPCIERGATLNRRHGRQHLPKRLTRRREAADAPPTMRSPDSVKRFIARRTADIAPRRIGRSLLHRGCCSAARRTDGPGPAEGQWSESTTSLLALAFSHRHGPQFTFPLSFLAMTLR